MSKNNEKTIGDSGENNNLVDLLRKLEELFLARKKNEKIIALLENKTTALEELRNNTIEAKENINNIIYEAGELDNSNYIKKLMAKIENIMYLEKKSMTNINYLKYLSINEYYFPTHRQIRDLMTNINKNIQKIEESLKNYNTNLEIIEIQKESYRSIFILEDSFKELKNDINFCLNFIDSSNAKLSNILSFIKKQTYPDYLKLDKFKFENEVSKFISNTKNVHNQMTDVLNNFIKNTKSIYDKMIEVNDFILKNDNRLYTNISITEKNNIAKIRLKIEANIKKLNEELSKTKKELSKAEEEIKNLNNHMQGNKQSVTEYINGLVTSIKNRNSSEFLEIFKNNIFMSTCLVLILIVFTILVFYILHFIFRNKLFNHKTSQNKPSNHKKERKHQIRSKLSTRKNTLSTEKSHTKKHKKMSIIDTNPYY